GRRAHPQVSRIGVVGVEAGAVDLDAVRARAQVFQVEAYRRSRTGRQNLGVEVAVGLVLPGRGEIPDEGFQHAIVPRHETLRVRGFQFVPAQRVEVLVGEVGRLADTLGRHQAEAALERRGRRAWLFEQVAEGTVAHALSQAFASLELSENIGGAHVRVVHGVARGVAGAPFGDVER